jgi:hypothetical protein
MDQFETSLPITAHFQFPPPHPDQFQTVIGKYLLEKVLFAKKLVIFDNFN